MIYAVLIGLLFILYLDARAFQQQDKHLFERAFRVSKTFILISAVLILLILLFAEDRWKILPGVVIFSILPLYLIRRSRFKEIAGTGLGLSRPGTPGEYPPSVLASDAYGVVLIWFLSMFFLGLFVKAVLRLPFFVESKLTELLFSAILSSVVAFILVYRASQKFSKEGFLTNMRLRKGNRSVGKVFVLPILVGAFFAWLSTFVMWTRDIQPMTPLSKILDATTSPGLLLIFLFLAVCLAPLIEEIIFRGYFFYVISKVKGKTFAVYCVALVFAFLHVGQYWGDWAAILMVVLLGFTLTILRAWTRTTLASVIAHYVYNAGVTALPFFTA